MGENMTVDAVASVVLLKLRELIKDKSFASNKIIGRRLRQMEQILQDTSWLSLVGAADKEPNAEEIKKLRKEYLSQIYSIEDPIESFALRFTRQRKKLGFLMNHALFLKNFTALEMLDSKLRKYSDEETQGLSSSMKRVKSSPALGNIKETQVNLRRNQSFKVLSRSDASMIRERYGHSKLMYSHSFNGKGLSMVGYQGKVGDLLHRLEYSDDLIIPIVGELGSGKTMLARAVYGSRSIKNKFKSAALVNIFKESTVKNILLALLNQVKKKSEVQDASDEKSLKDSLKEELNGRIYLVVLDGVQSLNQWKDLKTPSLINKMGARSSLPPTISK
ncbi:disease resistance protein RGA4-like [Salvia hispanica]|uniref:disease resistance protein RGA4-like n=1 Tax=Salvia hispanica TaxID=49212 RepID=UPI00200920F6|nr:disease resistance protein RGA4-like [Salvia hispanica]